MEKKWVKTKEIITICVAIVSLLISLYNWNVQRKFVGKYSHSVNEILLDSTRLEIKDLDLLYDNVFRSESEPVTKNEFEIILSSLKNNYQSLNDLKLTDISEKERLTYQMFRNDLLNTQDILDRNLKIIFSVSDEIENKSNDENNKKLDQVKQYPDQVFISSEQRKEFLEQIASSREDALWNIDRLEKKDYISRDILKNRDEEFAEHYKLKR